MVTTDYLLFSSDPNFWLHKQSCLTLEADLVCSVLSQDISYVLCMFFSDIYSFVWWRISTNKTNIAHLLSRYAHKSKTIF